MAKKVYGMNSIVIMNDSTYNKLQKCLGVNFEKETERQQRHYKKMLKEKK
jgi:hypothetical protein